MWHTLVALVGRTFLQHTLDPSVETHYILLVAFCFPPRQLGCLFFSVEVCFSFVGFDAVLVEVLDKLHSLEVPAGEE